MSKNEKNKGEIVFDAENPEWTEADFARAKKPEDILSASVLTAFPKTAKRLGRPIKENKKSGIYIRLSPTVLAHFKAMGKGWQTRIDEVLSDWVVTH